MVKILNAVDRIVDVFWYLNREKIELNDERSQVFKILKNLLEEKIELPPTGATAFQHIAALWNEWLCTRIPTPNEVTEANKFFEWARQRLLT